jgi:hypothetical protein
MPTVKFTLTGTLTVPEGTKIDKHHPHLIVLPDTGDVLTLWPVAELNHDRDLTVAEMERRGLWLESGHTTLELVDTEVGV